MASATGGLAVLEAEPEQGLFGGPDGVLPGLLKSSKDAKPDRASDANASLPPRTPSLLVQRLTPTLFWPPKTPSRKGLLEQPE